MIVIVAVGSRGDVQPCIALARALSAAGHPVRLAAPAPFEPLATRYGVAFAGLPIDPSAMLDGDIGRAWVESGRDPVAFVTGLARLGDTLGEPLADAVLDACAGADVIVYTTLAFPAWHVAEHRRVPAVQVSFVPLAPTADIPPVLLPDPFADVAPWAATPAGPLVRGYHRAVHWAFAELLWLPLRRRTNTWRRRSLRAAPLGWRSPALKAHDAGEPLLVACSPTVLPPPPDQPRHAVTTGYWFVDAPAEWRPPTDLAAYLRSGPPPVSIGMGSMTGRDPEQVTDIVVAALRRTRQRGLLLSGWAGLGWALRTSVPDDVDLFVTCEVPHDWLLPQVAASVHHGGAGTTAAGLRAGVPTVVVPHFGAGYWGDLLQLAWACENVLVDTSGSNQWMRWIPDEVNLEILFRKDCGTIGPGRVVFGSDSSWFPRGFATAYLDEQVRSMVYVGYSEDERDAVLYRNAAALLKLS